MKKVTKSFIYIIIAGIIFVYGVAVGLYKIFPFPQVLALKQYAEHLSGTAEAQRKLEKPGEVEIQDTFLQRLLLKKIQIPVFSGQGGGMAVSENLLTVVSNKGTVSIFNFENYTIFDSEISDVPMNLSGLIQSGHTINKRFSIETFRVNGVFTEKVNENSFVVYVSHNTYDSNIDCISSDISRTEIQLSGQSISQNGEWETLFSADPCIKINPEPDKISLLETTYPGRVSGGIMTNFDQQNLLVSMGDFNRHGIDGIEEWAMDPSNPYGKFILVNKKTGDWSIFASGTRNPSGLYIDNESVIWSVENGPRGGDELNIIEDGNNYGWPKVSYGLWYNPSYSLPGNQLSGTHPKYTKPVYTWIPSVAPKGLIKVESSKFEYWNGDLIIGTMRDQSLHRLRLDQNNRVIYDERIPIGQRIRDITTLTDGTIILLTDKGYLFIVDDGGPSFRERNTEVNEQMASLERFDRFIIANGDTLTMAQQQRSAYEIYQQNCASCHNLDPVNQVGPHLNELLGREVGTLENFNYSQTLKKDTREWDVQLLKTYLNSPNSDFAGTTMQKINLTNSEIDSLLNFFKDRPSGN